MRARALFGEGAVRNVLELAGVGGPQDTLALDVCRAVREDKHTAAASA